MKAILQQLIAEALASLTAQGGLEVIDSQAIHVERTRDAAHGDFACNIAMILAKKVRQKPRDLAEAIVKAIPRHELVREIKLAGPGFINFYLADTAAQTVIVDILKAKERYGESTRGGGQRVILESVSSNPTGPLHVGHGRGVAFGATVVNLLRAVGFEVHHEYYVNDAGRQMRILATSIWLRYLGLFEKLPHFPSGAYRGDYVIDVAKMLQEKEGATLQRSFAEVFDSLPEDTDETKDAYVDAVTERAESLLGERQFAGILKLGLDTILDDIRQDMEEFGVTFDEFFPESRLFTSGDLEHGLDRLRERGYLYEKNGATWFKATEFGDDKDRVVIRANGQTTYFASDIAYHVNKYERGFDHIIDVFGADHHGYGPRIIALLKAEGLDPEKFRILLVQFAILYRGKEKVQMSTRGGHFVTLRQLREEVGNDAARFFYIMRKNDQHLDFDLELAKSTSSDNPVYYIQYAHARICSVMRQLEERNWQWDEQEGLGALARLQETHETDLLRHLAQYGECIENAALRYEPHRLAHYLLDLANAFHTYYNAHQFLVEDSALRNARLCLIQATRQTLVNGLGLLGVAAPEAM